MKNKYDNQWFFCIHRKRTSFTSERVESHESKELGVRIPISPRDTKVKHFKLVKV
jgi:hypothetical protein